MSESENTDAVDQDTKHENNPRKRIRHRKKQVYENIMKQMEFYFSDANLSKDRYLGDLVKTDPFVPLSEFLKFNKIRSMTHDIGDIIKSMKHSTFLELSEDKLKVRRKTQLKPYDADIRTIYVESIPVTATREWLERVFSDYGQVTYVSLPKFKNSNKIKGFAFVEFSKYKEAQKCIAAFTKVGCKLPSCMQPEELSSIKMFTINDMEDNSDNNPDTKDDYEPPKKKVKKGKEKKPKSLDLKLDHESDSEKRNDTPTDENKSITTPTEEGKTTDIESKDGMTSQEENKLLDNTPRKKKLKKRSSKEKGKALNKGQEAKDALWGLQILPKSEWKALRNKYLNLQRKYMKEIKTNLYNKRHAYSGIPEPAAPSMEVEPVNSTREESGKNVEPLKKEPGLFVKEILSEPCLDVRATKRMIKTNIHVLHVDVKEGQSEAIIRFDNAKAADEYCANSSNSHILCGNEEEEQWQRAEAARASKRVRGRTRLLAKAAAVTEPAALVPASPQPTHTHIRFEDE